MLLDATQTILATAGRMQRTATRAINQRSRVSSILALMARGSLRAMFQATTLVDAAVLGQIVLDSHDGLANAFGQDVGRHGRGGRGERREEEVPKVKHGPRGM